MLSDTLWLLSIAKVASTTEELIFKLYVILSNLSLKLCLNSYIVSSGISQIEDM